MKKYHSPELEVCVLAKGDLLNGSDTLIDVRTLFCTTRDEE